MAVKWTPKRHENLLLLLLNGTPARAPDLVHEWAKHFKDEEYQPSIRAMSDQIAALKKRLAGGSTPKRAYNPGISAPQTPRTPGIPASSTPKTPRSSAKRRRADLSDEEESAKDSESAEEDEDLSRQLGQRVTISRRTKAAKKNYAQLAGEDEADDESEASVPALIADSSSSKDEAEGHAPGGAAETEIDTDPFSVTVSRSKATPLSTSKEQFQAGFHSGKVTKPRKTVVKHNDGFEDESDVSEFDPNA